MGGALSSNVATAVTNISNSVQNETEANSDQTASCITTYNLDQCHFKGNFKASNLCDIKETSTQIISSVQKNNVDNTISQQLAQTAAATVGTLGIGFADANNAANVYANSYNSLINAVTGSAQQNANTNFNFNCYGSDIDGDTIFDVKSSQTFLSDQVLKQNVQNQITNNVSQSITQTATATVEGISGLLLVLLLVIALIIWILFKPLQVAMGSRIVIIVIISVVIIALILMAYYLQWPPLFNPPVSCIATQAAIGGCPNDKNCVSSGPETITLKAPPLRYAYPIIGQGDVTVDPQNTYVPGLLQMDISAKGGWTDRAYNYFKNNSNFNGLPNPLYISGQDKNGNNIYKTNVNGDPNNPNDKGWQGYISASDQNAGNGRLVLAHDLSLDTYARIWPFEQCYLNGKLTSTGCYQFNPSTMPPNPQVAVTVGGTITGPFGICDNTSQKVIRIACIVFIIILLIIFIILAFRKPTTAQTTTRK